MSELSFKGKEFVYNHHLSVPFRPLVPEAGKGIGEVALDGNLIVHGDNLHALKALLPHRAGQVDCVFIDPPYNTGNEGWCYNDNVNAPMIREWLNSNPVGVEDGLRHDKWCAMMWPRLRLLVELLSDRGTIWLTLDDNEAHRAKLMLDEILGERCFVANVVWEKTSSARNDAKLFSADHDHLLVYCKDPDNLLLNRLDRTESSDAAYSNPDDDPRGPWREGDYKCAKSAEERPNLYYPITNPHTGKDVLPRRERVWAYSRDETDKNEREGRLWWGKTGNYTYPKLKRFRKDAPPDLVPRTLWHASEVRQTRTATTQLREIFGGENPFATAKPVELVQRVIQLATTPYSIVLDSFAGSGTTAHAVLAQNRQDEGERKFILVEMEEYAESLTAERVRRVITGYGYEGTNRTELMRERLSWRTLGKAEELTQAVEAIERLHGGAFDRIKKTVDSGDLVVVGEKSIQGHTDGLGGEFTMCSLGPPLELDALLKGDSLPAYAALGSALFHMATGKAIRSNLVREDDGYLGMADGQHVWLVYRPDLEWLKSSDAALTLTRAKIFAEYAPGDRHLVFAPARYVSQKMLAEHNLPVDFAPLPFALYRIDRS